MPPGGMICYVRARREGRQIHRVHNMVEKTISEKLKRIGICLEYGVQETFPAFAAAHTGERILLLADRNTRRYAEELMLPDAQLCLFDEEEPVPDEGVCDRAVEGAKRCDYVLAVGSGTLNDTAKYAALMTGKRSGVLATAPSMDGYASPVAAIMKGGFKVSEAAHVPADILIDPAILADAPQQMIAAGAGDILGKYTCLTDWRLAQYHTGEAVNEEAFSDMLGAVQKFAASVDDIARREKSGVEKLTDALIISGLAMAEAGNSRPASGAEHHISHHLEMWFVAQKKRVPLHGIKVGLGTLVSAYLYEALERDGVTFRGDDKTYLAAKAIPSVPELRATLERLGAPVRFSALGISRELFRETIAKAHTVRPRYTILTLLEELGLTGRYIPQLEREFY